MQFLLESSGRLHLCVSNSFSNLLVCPIPSRIFGRIQNFPLVDFPLHKMGNRERAQTENLVGNPLFSAKILPVDKKKPEP
jgi:hypothetical protein